MPNLFPTQRSNSIEEQTSAPVKFGRSWMFDFDTGDFVLSPTGKVAVSTGIEAYGEWCQKALLTPRYRHIIYSRLYGSDLEEMIGKGFPRAVAESEIKRIVTETLKVDARTKDVQNFSYIWAEDAVEFTCDVITVNSDVIQTGAKVVMVA